MDTTDPSVPFPRRRAVPMPAARILGAYLQETRSELLRYLRNPGFLLPTLLFPTVFYLMFGVLMGRQGGADAARYLLASYATFGVMAPGLFGFGVSLAAERDGGLLTLKRALPMPPLAYLAGKMVMAMCVAAAIMVLLMLLAVFAAHLALTPLQAVRLFVTGILGVLPFCALGLLLGTVVRGQGAPGLINMVYLPMAFLSGLWFPLTHLPRLQQFAPVWPSWHLDQLALAAVGMGHGALPPHVLALSGYTTVFLWIAARRLRRNG